MEQSKNMQELISFIASCPTAYQTVETLSGILTEQGFVRLEEQNEWKLKSGEKYFVTRNGSSILAFCLPRELDRIRGYHIVATHGDAPSLKLKPVFEQKAEGCATQWNVERYGGAILSSWMDRPLSVAGRVAVKTEDGVRLCPVHLDRDVALIPNVAIHMNRKVNEGVPINVQVDMLPLSGLGLPDSALMRTIAALLNVEETDIISHDLFLYVRNEGRVWGMNNEFISAPRLDDLMCTYAALKGFLSPSHPRTVPVLAVFDNEEIGSSSRQGAASSLLRDTLTRVDACFAAYDTSAGGLQRRLSGSCLISADNAHAVHPNHPEYADKQNRPVINGGVVIKHNAEQRYATDAISGAIFARICDRAGVPTQVFANRSDMRGGSTLGNIAVSDVPCLTVDIGLAQLAMHSAYETAGVQDFDSLCAACRAFYASSLIADSDRSFRIE